MTAKDKCREEGWMKIRIMKNYQSLKTIVKICASYLEDFVNRASSGPLSMLSMLKDTRSFVISFTSRPFREGIFQR